MAVLDQQEQESIDAIKAWWQRYGKLITVLAILIIAAVGAMQYWQYYQRSQSLKAAELYFSLQQAERNNEKDKVAQLNTKLRDEYPSTGYPAMAALTAARVHYLSGDKVNAKAQLQWIVDKSGDSELRGVARLRLARLFFEDKDYAGTIRLVDAAKSGAFSALCLDVKGDALFALGKLAEAKLAYQTAYDAMDKESPYRNVIELKLDSLGSTK